MKKFCLYLIALLLILTGCVEKEILDDVNLITVAGFDSIEENKIRGNAIINTYLKDQPVVDYHIEDVSELSRDILSNMQKKSPDPLVLGKLQIVLYGEKLANVGINELVDTLQRDASISERLALAVARGEAKNILEADFSTLGASRFLHDLIRHNEENRDLPRTNLHVFLFQFYSKGQDPFLPIFKRTENTVQVDGLALFDSQKLVGEISNEQLIFFKMLVDEYSKGTYTLNIPNSEQKAGIRSISTSRKIKLVSTDPLKVDISVHLEGYIHEYTGKKITPEVIEKVEKGMKDSVEQEISLLFEKFKELKIDPIGIGDKIRSQSRDFNIDQWREKIPELDVNVDAEVIISETGVID